MPHYVTLGNAYITLSLVYPHKSNHCINHTRTRISKHTLTMWSKRIQITPAHSYYSHTHTHTHTHKYTLHIYSRTHTRERTHINSTISRIYISTPPSSPQDMYWYVLYGSVRLKPKFGSIMYSVHYTMYCVQCTINFRYAQCTVYIVQCTVYNVHCTQQTVYIPRIQQIQFTVYSTFVVRYDVSIFT